mmetsp:Transcript_3819/g.11881  ORF Transcript_3819/g.11881 Transcript_3819/m.11881 type:complete len:249 (-) Transcript_3819:109-855(-)
MAAGGPTTVMSAKEAKPSNFATSLRFAASCDVSSATSASRFWLRARSASHAFRRAASSDARCTTSSKPASPNAYVLCPSGDVSKCLDWLTSRARRFDVASSFATTAIVPLQSSSSSSSRYVDESSTSSKSHSRPRTTPLALRTLSRVSSRLTPSLSNSVFNDSPKAPASPSSRVSVAAYSSVSPFRPSMYSEQISNASPAARRACSRGCTVRHSAAPSTTTHRRLLMASSNRSVRTFAQPSFAIARRS